jgi:hemoglobin
VQAETNYEESEMETQSTSLYGHLGGISPITTVVDDFIARIMVDDRLNTNPRVAEAHHRVLPPGSKYLVTEMLAEAAGGPQRYTGRSMEESHRDLLITSDEWDAFMGDLSQSLDQFAVPHQESSDVIALVESMRSEIVPEVAEERAAPPPAEVA